MAKTPSKKSARRLSLMALEPRLVFDGAIAVTDINPLDRDPGVDLTAIAEAAAKAASVDVTTLREAATKREIAFVDNSLADLQGLLDGIGASVEVIQIDHAQEGLAQINAALAGRGSFDAIHILAHGSAGSQSIGTTVLDAAHLDSLKTELASLGASLTAEGDLLLYGCDVAQGEAGQALVQQLARLTGADVAASDDRTGWGGDWTLEQRLGAIESQSLSATDWQGQLAITVTGTKVNEGSPIAPFTVTGLTVGSEILLAVADKTTTGMVNAGIQYSQDNGATWQAVAGAIKVTSTNMLVAVSDTPETMGSIAQEGLERYQLAVTELPSSVTFQLETPNFLVAGEGERYTKTQLAGTKTVFTFDGSWSSKSEFTRTLSLGGVSIGSVTFPHPQSFDEFGGAKGSKFVTASDDTPVTINLTTAQNYFGFWWSAGDDGNILEFYKDGQLVETFRADLMNDNFPEIQLGNPYVRDDDGTKSSSVLPEAQQANNSEKYSFLNFFMKSGQTFDKIVMRGSNFEFDNLTFIKNGTGGAVGDGTIVDDGSGVYVSLDAEGNPVVDSGTFLNDLNAIRDNDYNTTPSLNDCWYVAPVDLLANDAASGSSAALDPASVKLYTSPTSTGTGEGGSTLSTSLGEFEVTPTGTLFFKPSATFNGASDTLTLYYTVADSTGSVSARTAVHLDPNALSADQATAIANGSIIPYAETNANASELFRFDANGNPINATYNANSTTKATSLTVDLQTDLNYDPSRNTTVYPAADYLTEIDNSANNGGAGGVQAKLQVDTTAITSTSGSQVAVGFGIPGTNNFGDAVDVLNLTSKSAATYRSDPYYEISNLTRSVLGAGDSQSDFYTSQQLTPTVSTWTDFDPLVNAWVKFSTTEANITALRGKNTNTDYLAGTITLTFQDENGIGLGSNNPLIHVAGLGDWLDNSNEDATGSLAASLKMVSAQDADGNAIAGATLSKLSGSSDSNGKGFDVTNNVISNTVNGGNGQGATAFGTAKVDGNGTSVSAVTFEVYLKGYWNGKTAFGTGLTYGGETFYLSTSTFIGPDTQGASTAQTAAAADAMNRMVQVCGVNNVDVNEGSPYAIFQVGGFEGSQILDLNLTSGSGTYGLDTGTLLQYYDPLGNGGTGAWIDYNGGAITIPENGDGSQFMPTKLLVRVAITNDAPADNGEQLTLSVTYPSEIETGTLTIHDDGTGSVFSADNTTGSPDPLDTRFPHTALNDDVIDTRPITINNLTVNEASPFAIFTVTGKEGQTLSLGSLTSGTGTVGVDTGTGLEYFNGTAWVPYTPGQSIRLGYGSDNVLDANADATLLVRVAVINDLDNEISETLTLTATPNEGTAANSVTGTLTIVDRNDGVVFATDNTSGVPDQPGATGIPEVLDDDTPDSRPVTIDDLTVNEGSPFAVFTVSAAAGQRVVLGLPASGTAEVGTDTGTGLEYFNGTDWVAYIPTSEVETPASGKILVRVAIVQDTLFEGPQTFTITASNVNKDTVTGTGTIVDDGTGTLFATRADKPGTAANEAVTGVNSDGTPVLDTTTAPDNDRPITVNNVSVNEASPYIVFEVSGGIEGQALKLTTQNVTATVGTDTGGTLQYFNGTDWVNYTRGAYITIPSDGDSTPGEAASLLVRLAVKQDSSTEGVETFKLMAIKTNGQTASGIGAICDDGTGLLFSASNTTGTPEAPGSASDLPTALTRVGAPIGCWSVGSLDLVEALNLPDNQDIDWATVDLDPDTAGVQTSKDVYSGSTKLGTYVLNNAEITFVPTGNFNGTAPDMSIRVSTVVYQLDADGESLLDSNGDPVTTPGSNLTSSIGVGVGSTADMRISVAEVCGVNSVIVNEGSPWAVFDVKGVETGQIMNITLSNGTGTAGVDTGDIEYFNGSAWVPYVAGQPVTIPSDGDGTAFEATTLKVRVAIVNDAPLETVSGVGEQLTLSVTYDHGEVESGTLTIMDDGTGDVFGDANTTGVPDVPGESTDASVPVELNNDDVPPLLLDDVTVNEASPYLVFTVSGQAAQPVVLGLTSGTATVGLDTSAALQYFDGSQWQDYTPDSEVNVPEGGQLLVRVAVEQDGIWEKSESFTLTATDANQIASTGTGTILDDGTGTIWTFDPPANIGDPVTDPGTPTTADLPSDGFDDDRPLSVGDEWVYEDAGFAVITVTGAPGQLANLALSNGSATLSSDTAAANTLQYWSGSAWETVPASGQVRIDPNGDGSLKVRLAVTADSETETPETFVLSATNEGGRTATGTVTILDGSDPVPYADSSDNVSQCWTSVTLNVLANDVPVTGFRVGSVLLYASNAADAVGSKSLTTDYGTYVANADGTVTFTPVSTLPDGSWFNGQASVIYYSVMDGAERTSLAEIHIGDGVSGGSNASAVGDYTLDQNSTLTNTGDGHLVSLGSLSGDGSKIFAMVKSTSGKDQWGDPFFYVEDQFINLSYYYDDPTDPNYPENFTLAARDFFTSLQGDLFNPESANALEWTTRSTDVMIASGNHETGTSGYFTVTFQDEEGRPISVDGVNFTIANVGQGDINYPDSLISSQLTLTDWTSSGGVQLAKVSGSASMDVAEKSDGLWHVTNLGDPTNQNKFDFYYGAMHGTFAVKGAGITSLTFRVDMSASDPNSVWTDQGDAWTMILEVPPASPVKMDSVPMLEKTCGINDVVINEGSPWAVFTVNGVEGQSLTLDLQDGTGIEGIDTNGLQYLDPSDNTWKDYTPGQSLTLPDNGDVTVDKAQILVRVGIVNDAPYEVSEQLTLAATFDNGLVETGTLTIKDDGTGAVFLDDNTTALPNVPGDSGYPAALNDDRGTGPQVDSIVVNEASPYAIFTINGVAGAGVDLTLGDGDAKPADLWGGNADIGDTLEFWDASADSWVTYDGDNAFINADGQLLVRVAVTNDDLYEISEDFTLTVAYNANGVTAGVTNGASSTGQGVIKDDGTGTIFISSDTDPGVNDQGVAEIDLDRTKDDDVPLSVSDVTVNEGSPYANFWVNAALGSSIQLSLNDGTATVGIDTDATLQYFDGSDWVDYTADTFIEVPDAGYGDGVGLWLPVRVAIVNDNPLEAVGGVGETFTLTAKYASGRTATGTGTIMDDGSGALFGAANISAFADDPLWSDDPTVPAALDDDRVVPKVSDVIVNEGSPYAVFEVSGVPGATVAIRNVTGTAQVGDIHAEGDFDWANGGATGKQVFVGEKWVEYTVTNFPNWEVTLPEDGVLLVRNPLGNQANHEGPETFQLEAWWGTNQPDTLTVNDKVYTLDKTAYVRGTATILDNGQGLVFDYDSNTTSTPQAQPTADQLDDDRPLAVNDVTVNEADGYANFTVTGAAGQYATLSLASLQATVGTDTGTVNDLQWFNPATGQWVDYAEGDRVQLLPNGSSADTGVLKVRVPVTVDSTFEYSENFNLIATNTGGTSAYGMGTITDVGASTPTQDVSGVTDVVVNEASPWAVFAVKGSDGQSVQLNLQDGTGSAGVDTGDLQVLVDGVWVDYTPGDDLVFPTDGTDGSAAELLVRVAIVNDAPFERSEVLNLVARYDNGVVESGTLTILDDGTGAIFLGDKLSAEPSASTDTGYPTRLNDDRGANPLVDSITVNEGSEYAVFTVAGVPGARMDVSFADGTAGRGSYGDDYFRNTLQYWNDASKSWVAYSENADGFGNALVNASGTALLRVALGSQAEYEGPETFDITVAYNRTGFKAGITAGGQSTGVGTIVDDGTGVYFATGNADDGAAYETWSGGPYNPDATALGVSAMGGAQTLADPTGQQDDRTVSVSNVSVNEGSPYANFLVHGEPGQPLALTLKDGTANIGVDTGTQLQFFNGSDWVDYTPGSTISVPDFDGGDFAVRVAIVNDRPLETVSGVGETFTLTAYYPNNKAGGANGSDMGPSATGTGTIVDDGAGEVFGAMNPSADALNNSPVDPSIPDELDDDQPKVIIDPVVVNEGSPYAVFTLHGQLDATTKLGVMDATAEQANGDYTDALEVLVSGVWVPYSDITDGVVTFGGTADEFGDGQLLVRVPLGNQAAYEGPEDFYLTAFDFSPTPDRTFKGKGTILDDGTGAVFGELNTTGTPDTLGVTADDSLPARLDDDRPLRVTDVTVNEAQGFALMQVKGQEGQLVQLSLADGSAIVADDTTTVECFDGSTWQPYVPGSFVAIPTRTDTSTEGSLQVRVGLAQDAAYEMAEQFTLTAVNTGGESATGTATILDGGDGSVIGANDRAPEVKGSTVNEASPYLLFSVNAPEGQDIRLDLADGSAQQGVDTVHDNTLPSDLEYFNGTEWVTYDPTANGGYLTMPTVGAADNGETAQLLVRVPVKQDAVNEADESLTLTATTRAGLSDSGVGIIQDDGQGDVFLVSNNSDVPNLPEDAGYPAVLDHDRGANPAVNSLTVNEGSDFAIFTVQGVPGAALTLATSDGNAKTTDADYSAAPLEFWNAKTSAWETYAQDGNGDGNALVGANGQVLVRVALGYQTPFEGDETLSLTATYNSLGMTVGVTVGGSASGVATLVDDGTGLLFAANGTTNKGVDNTGLPQIDRVTPNKDDRPIAVSDVQVNEGSPYASFQVDAVAGQPLRLALASDTATVGVDTGTQLEYFDGNDWVAYAPGSLIDAPADSFAVRVAIHNDVPLETLNGVGETFTLSARYANGHAASGTGTILDDGTGQVFGAASDDATPVDPSTSTDPSVPDQLDDDTPPAVSGMTVNESSPYLVYTVTAPADTPLVLSLTNGTGDTNTDTDEQLEYFDGSNWQPYTPGSTADVPASGKLLVRVGVVQDSPFEGEETFQLTVTNPQGVSASGLGAIVDDGTGDIVANTPNASNVSNPGTDPAPVLDTSTAQNDDRGANPAVNSITVNEASPYAVFTVSGVAGAGVDLALASGSATVGTDTGTALEYFDGSDWVSASSGAVIGANGRVQVRVAVVNDSPLEVSEAFTLSATYNASGTTTGVTVGGSAIGTGTITDDGTGDVFAATATSAPVDADGLPALDTTTPRNDDRPVVVSGDTVSEDMPYLSYAVTGLEGQAVKLALIDGGSATAGSDTGTALEYFDGSDWVAYTPDSLVSLPVSGATADPSQPSALLVRVAVKPDGVTEGDETLKLQATTAFGLAATGVGTIQDAPLASAPRLDDDRPLAVNSVRVNEASPQMVFTVSGAQGQDITLQLAGGTASLGSDTGTALEWYDPEADGGAGAWTAYTPGQGITMPGNGNPGSPAEVLVRVAVKPDTVYERSEFVTLIATNGSGTPATGIGTIVDDGTGALFGDDNTTGVPDAVDPTQSGSDASLPRALDDDRPIAINNVDVNEGGRDGAINYAVFEITGVEGQAITGLSLASGSAEVGTDTGTQLQWFNGTAWVDVDDTSVIAFANDGDTAPGEVAKALVRVAITPDNPYEGAHDFTLTATSLRGSQATGTGTIHDDGTGDLFGVNNTTGVPNVPAQQGAPTALDDDRPLTVNDVTVNEASPYIVFKIDAVEGQPMSLTLTEGSAQFAQGEDLSDALEVWSGSAWVAYNGTSAAATWANADGDALDASSLLVRAKVTQDSQLENSEQFTLTATYTTGPGNTSTGTGTIVDDGTGTIFLSGLDDPATPGVENPTGIDPTTGLPLTQDPLTAMVVDPINDVLTMPDDDRPLTVNDVTVNEASPFAVFTVAGREGQYVQLALGATSNGSDASLGTDTGTALEYWSGSAWTAYTPGDFVQIPADGDTTANEPANLLVRVAILPDALDDNGETFTLTATNTGGSSDTGVGTIVDHGSASGGSVFATSATDAGVNPATATTPATPVTLTPVTAADVDPAALTPSQVVLDDDRVLSVNDIDINEGSDYVMWTVSGAADQYVQLALASGTATVGVDTAAAETLEVFDGNAWQRYTAGHLVKVPTNMAGQLLVRLAVTPDFIFEDAETLTLTATNTGGTSATGTATIHDDGTGELFGAANVTGTPNTLADLGLALLDDDRVTPPIVQPEAVPPAPEEAPQAPTAPAIFVQASVAEGRAAVSVSNPETGSGLVTQRAAGPLASGSNVLQRTAELIDAFDRPTDPNLYVLPQVKVSANEAFGLQAPSLSLQSGLLMQEIDLQDSTAALIQVSEASDAAPTLADQTLAELSQEAKPGKKGSTLVALTAEQARELAAERLAQKQGEHLAAAREALKAEAPVQPARGQLSFTQQLKLSAAKRAHAARSVA